MRGNNSCTCRTCLSRALHVVEQFSECAFSHAELWEPLALLEPIALRLYLGISLSWCLDAYKREAKNRRALFFPSANKERTHASCFIHRNIPN